MSPCYDPPAWVANCEGCGALYAFIMPALYPDIEFPEGFVLRSVGNVYGQGAINVIACPNCLKEGETKGGRK